MQADPHLVGVRAEGIVKRFGSSVALAGADIAVPSGRIAAVTGANGAGKTTLLRILATLVHPDAGTAWVAGADVVREPERARRALGVALVNERGLYWRLSGAYNLGFFGRLAGLSRREAAERASDALRAAGLDALAGRAVGGYSAGQRQRLILARATIASPAVLLLDEPTRGLDEEGIERVGAMLRAHAARGATVIVAAPTTAEVEGIAEEIFELRAGTVVGHRVIASAGVDR